MILKSKMLPFWSRTVKSAVRVLIGLAVTSCLVVFPLTAAHADTSPAALSAANVALLASAVISSPPTTQAATSAVTDIAGAPSAAVLAPLMSASVGTDDGIAAVGSSLAAIPTAGDNTLSLSDTTSGTAVGLSIVGATTTAASGDAAVTQSVDPGTSVISHVTPDG